MLISVSTPADPWRPPEGFPLPPVPTDNPVTEAKIVLGRQLFYDTAWSVNQSISCASCHHIDHAFADDVHPSTGAFNDPLPRNALPLINLAWRSAFGWADTTVRSLEAQMLQPLYNQHPVELGLVKGDEALRSRLATRDYAQQFAHAFPDDADPITATNLVKAIATFERTLVSANSVFDDWVFRGIRPPQQVVDGFTLFTSDRLGCNQCHSGVNFSGDFRLAEEDITGAWHNTGVVSTDQGLYLITTDPADYGKFKTPTLRNIACTAPYMHDGSMRSLDEVIDHYQSGPEPDKGLRRFQLTADERAQLIAFLRALTDPVFLTNPALDDPGHSPVKVPAPSPSPMMCR